MLATRNVRKFIIFLLDLELQIKNFSYILFIYFIYIVRDTKAIGYILRYIEIRYSSPVSGFWNSLGREKIRDGRQASCISR